VVYDVLDELVLVEVTVPETTEEDVGPVVEEELDDVTVPLIVLLELVGLELEVEEDKTEDVLLDELLTATEEELLGELELLVVELVVVVDELEALETVDELVLLVAELIEVLLVIGEELLLVVELVDEVELLLVVELVEVLLVVGEELLLVVEVVDVLDVVDDELELVVAAAELEELVLVVQTPGEAGTDPHWYTSNLFPAPQNSLGAPPQGILQSDNGAETLPHCNWFPQ
jgi:hypothetical protein